jgi:hypothetical protein
VGDDRAGDLAADVLHLEDNVIVTLSSIGAARSGDDAARERARPAV